MVASRCAPARFKRRRVQEGGDGVDGTGEVVALGFRAIVDDLLRGTAGEGGIGSLAPRREVELARFFVDAEHGKLDAFARVAEPAGVGGRRVGMVMEATNASVYVGEKRFLGHGPKCP